MIRAYLRQIGVNNGIHQTIDFHDDTEMSQDLALET